MGFELLTQPQVFLAPITAVGGIQNGLLGDPLPPLYTSFYTWTSTASITATTFPLGGIETITNKSGAYIVTVGGVVQAPTNYIVDTINRSLTFDFTVNADTPVVVTQIGTIASLLSVTDLTATNSYLENVTAVNSVFQNVNADSLLVTNLTALTAEFQIIDIVQYELSGFSVQGDAIINGTTVISTSSTDNALRVTQTGTGNAILVEDDTNPDATPFVVKGDGSVGIGTTNPTSNLQVSRTTAGNSTIIKVENVSSATATTARFDMATGTANAYSILSQEESTIGPFGQLAHGAGNIGGMWFTSGTTSAPIVFRQSSTERMRIDGSGNVGIGTQIPNQALTVTGNISATGNLTIGPGITALNLPTPIAGSIEYSLSKFFTTHDATGGRGLILAPHWVRLNANRTKPNNNTTLENVFDATNDTISLIANTLYHFKGMYILNCTAASTTVLPQIGFSFSQTPVEIFYRFLSTIRTGVNQPSIGVSTVVTATTVASPGSISATNYIVEFEGYFRSNATTGGTFAPQFAQSVAGTSAAPTMVAGTWFMLQPIGGTGDVVLAGSWS